MLIYSKLQKFQLHLIFMCMPAYLLLAVRTGSARCRPPDVPQDMYNRVGFMNVFLLRVRPLCHLASFYPLLAFLLCSIKKAQS